jgi:hypothetical protein
MGWIVEEATAAATGASIEGDAAAAGRSASEAVDVVAASAAAHTSATVGVTASEDR